MEPKWITFNEVLELTGLNRRTTERRLKLFRERHPELYSLISKAIGRKKFYLDPSITFYLSQDPRKLGREKTDYEIIQELLSNEKHFIREPRTEFLRDLPTKKDKDGDVTYISQFHNDDNRDDKQAINLDPRIKDILEKPEEMTKEECSFYQSIKTKKERKQFKLGLEIIYSYCFSTLTIEQACKAHGITARTFQRWVKKMSFLSDFYLESKLIKKKEEDEHIQESLEYEILRMSSGYNVELPTIYYDIIQDMRGVLHRIPYRMIVKTKHIRKNVRAAIFWLRNHCPDEYPYG